MIFLRTSFWTALCSDIPTLAESFYIEYQMSGYIFKLSDQYLGVAVRDTRRRVHLGTPPGMFRLAR